MRPVRIPIAAMNPITSTAAPAVRAASAPNYGDWIRHSTGTTSGALGHEGLDFEGEDTWGESERRREQADASGSDASNPAPDPNLNSDRGNS